MSKILYVKDELHRRLKIMSTQLNLSMQEATEEAVAQWLTSKEAEQAKLLESFNAIKEKLSSEDKSVIEKLIQQNTAAVNVIKTKLNIEESKIVEALLSPKKGEQ